MSKQQIYLSAARDYLAAPGEYYGSRGEDVVLSPYACDAISHQLGLEIVLDPTRTILRRYFSQWFDPRHDDGGHVSDGVGGWFDPPNDNEVHPNDNRHWGQTELGYTERVIALVLCQLLFDEGQEAPR